MNTFHKKRLYIFLSTLALLWSSCVSDVWQEHYENTGKDLGTKSLMELINERADLTDFKRMLEITGYDSILNADQTYTVWAPTNSDLEQLSIELMDTSSISEIVQNHIARFNYPTADFNTDSVKKVYMLSKKFVPFSKENSIFTFGAFTMKYSNLLAKNGILHVLDGYVPYSSNVWESLGRIAQLDSVYNYLKPLGSTPFGDLNNEDSIYTAILPNNNAWIEMYNTIEPYFNCLPTLPKDSSQAKQRRLVQNAIIQDAIFKTSISDPNALETPWLVNTSNHLFNNASRLFEGAVAHKASNGYVWVSDSLRYTATESWHREIRVEAENISYGRTSQNANVYWRSSENSGFNISGNRYIVAIPLTTSKLQSVFVSFPIPNTLSAKYKIYCVFAPPIISESKPLPCLVNYYLDYVNSTGNISTEKVISNDTISATNVSKRFVKEITLPYCNIISNGNNKDITVKLKVETAASNNQSTIFTRTMFIDCIILEPVE